MTRAADLIDALLARKPGRLILERRSGMPYGWSIWMRGRDAAGPAFGEQALIATLQARPPVPGGGILPQLSLWQAFRQLWWQHWEPAPRDERPLHWASVAASALLHLLFAALLLWMALVHWAAPEPAPAEEGRVQLSLIGEGAPDAEGGAAGAAAAAKPAPVRPAAQAATAPAATTASSAASTPPAEPPAPAAVAVPEAAQLQAPAVVQAEPASPPPVPPQRQQVELQRPEPAATPAAAAPTPMTIDPQPVQATETEVASTDFVVPPPPSLAMSPPTPRPQPSVPQVRERTIETVSDAPQLAPLPPRDLSLPPLPALPVASVREREITAAPVPDVQLAMPQARMPTPQLALPDVSMRQREVREPAPAAAQAQSATPAEAPAPVAAPTSSPAAAQAQAQAAVPASVSPPSAAGGNAPQPASGQAGTRSAGAGPAPVDRSGGWAAPKPGDDWGMGTRVQDGARQAGTSSRGEGLFDDDGRVRVPPGQGANEPPRGAPGGDTDSWSRDRIANSGTWLKRPPYDYTPTSFDRYWVPNESLLEEWVRKGIKKIEIAIPGTSTKISCVVSLLQFGGGCGLTDPNMQDQPAEARPPPDIPFKKELQEDNGSVR